MDRIDALPRRRATLQHFRGAVLSTAPDPVLDELVERARQALRTPTALVTLLLERLQMFRAHRGLGEDLAATCATDRELSFCQFVVRDGRMFEVTDARNDERVPQEAVTRFGVGAYLGAPVAIAGEVVGSLCVVSPEPRVFTADERRELTTLAVGVSARLGELVADERGLERELHARAVRPVFGEIRNQMQPLLFALSLVRVAAAEIAALKRAPAATISSLSQAFASFGDLEGAVTSAESSAELVCGCIDALERASLGAHRGKLGELVEAASTIAHHDVKLVGGVTWQDIPRRTLDLPRSGAVTAIAAALTAVGGEIARAGARDGVRGTVICGDAQTVVRLASPHIDLAASTRLCASFSLLVGKEARTTFVARDNAIEIVFDAVAR